MLCQRVAEPVCGLRIVLYAINPNHYAGWLSGHRHGDLMNNCGVWDFDGSSQAPGAMQDGAPPDGDGRLEVAFNGNCVDSQFAAGRQHAIDDDARGADAFRAGDFNPLARFVKTAETGIAGEEFMKRLGGAYVGEIAVQNRAPKRLAGQGGVQLADRPVLVFAKLPLPAQGQGEMPVQIHERDVGARVGAPRDT